MAGLRLFLGGPICVLHVLSYCTYVCVCICFRSANPTGRPTRQRRPGRPTSLRSGTRRSAARPSGPTPIPCVSTSASWTRDRGFWFGALNFHFRFSIRRPSVSLQFLFFFFFKFDFWLSLVSISFLFVFVLRMVCRYSGVARWKGPAPAKTETTAHYRYRYRRYRIKKKV